MIGLGIFFAEEESQVIWKENKKFLKLIIDSRNVN